MPQSEGLTLEQAQAIGFKPSAVTEGVNLSQAQGMGFKPADDVSSILQQQAAKYPTQAESGVPIGESTALSRAREIPLGVAEGLGIDPSSPLYGTVKNIVTGVHDSVKRGGMIGLFKDLASGVVKAPIQAGLQIGNGIVNNDWDSVANGVGRSIGIVGAMAAGTDEAKAGAAAAVDKTGQAVSAVGDAASGALKDSAANDFMKIMNPTTKPTKFVAQKVAPELADRGVVAATQAKLFSKVIEAKQTAGQALDSAWSKIPDGTTLPTAPILDAIDRAKSKFVVDNVDVLPAATGKIDELKGIIQQFGDDVSPQSLRQTRQIFDEIVDRSAGYAGKDLAETSRVFAQKQVANAIRRSIGDAYPDIKKLNAEFSFWSNVEDVLGAKELRDVGKSLTLRDLMAGSTGATLGGMKFGGLVGGPIGAAVGPLVLRFAQSTAWRTTSAAVKTKIANLISAGEPVQAAVIIRGLLPEKAGAPYALPAADTGPTSVMDTAAESNSNLDQFIKQDKSDRADPYAGVDSSKTVVSPKPGQKYSLVGVENDPLTGNPKTWIYTDLQTGEKIRRTSPLRVVATSGGGPQ